MLAFVACAHVACLALNHLYSAGGESRCSVWSCLLTTALSFDPVSTPAHATQGIHAGDIVRVGTSFKNDLEVVWVNQTSISFATPCLGSDANEGQALYQLQRSVDEGAARAPPDASRDAASCLASSALKCLASSLCAWDSVTLECSLLPRRQTPSAVVNVTGFSTPPFAIPTADASGFNVSLASAKPPDISLNLSKLNFHAPNLSASLLVKMPKFVVPKPAPRLPKVFDPLAALMKILNMLKAIIMPILANLLKPILKIFMGIITDVISLILGPYLFPAKGLPFPFPLRFPMFPAFKLPTLKVPLPKLKGLKLPNMTVPSINMPGLGFPGISGHAGEDGGEFGGGSGPDGASGDGNGLYGEGLSSAVNSSCDMHLRWLLRPAYGV